MVPLDSSYYYKQGNNQQFSIDLLLYNLFVFNFRYIFMAIGLVLIIIVLPSFVLFTKVRILLDIFHIFSQSH